MLRTKPVEDVLAQTGGPDGEGHAPPTSAAGGSGPGHHRLVRRLGPVDLMGFGIGIVIGTGIFTLTGIEAKNHAGPGVVISFVIAGAVSLLAALCHAELASSVPTAGSAYTYAYATIGEDAPVNVGAMAVVALLGVVAVIGIRESARVTNLLVAVKVLICVFVIVLGAFFVTSANLTPFIPPARPVDEGTSGLKQPLSQALFGIEPTAFRSRRWPTS